MMLRRSVERLAVLARLRGIIPTTTQIGNPAEDALLPTRSPS
jgi:hypothetical protein